MFCGVRAEVKFELKFNDEKRFFICKFDLKFDVSKRGDICAQACVFVKFGSNLVKSLVGLIKKEA